MKMKLSVWLRVCCLRVALACARRNKHPQQAALAAWTAAPLDARRALLARTLGPTGDVPADMADLDELWCAVVRLASKEGLREFVRLGLPRPSRDVAVWVAAATMEPNHVHLDALYEVGYPLPRRCDMADLQSHISSADLYRLKKKTLAQRLRYLLHPDAVVRRWVNAVQADTTKHRVHFLLREGCYFPEQGDEADRVWAATTRITSDELKRVGFPGPSKGCLAQLRERWFKESLAKRRAKAQKPAKRPQTTPVMPAKTQKPVKAPKPPVAAALRAARWAEMPPTRQPRVYGAWK